MPRRDNRRDGASHTQNTKASNRGERPETGVARPYKSRVLDRRKLGLGEVDKALDPEVSVLVKRQELDPVK